MNTNKMCGTCFSVKEPFYQVNENEIGKDIKHFCSEKCYRVFLDCILKTKEGPKELVSKRKFRITRKVRDKSPDSMKVPQNTPEFKDN